MVVTGFCKGWYSLGTLWPPRFCWEEALFEGFLPESDCGSRFFFCVWGLDGVETGRRAPLPGWGCAGVVRWCGVAFFCASPAEWIEGDVSGAVVSAGCFVVWEEELCVCWEPEGLRPRDRLSSSQALRKVFRGGGGDNCNNSLPICIIAPGSCSLLLSKRGASAFCEFALGLCRPLIKRGS